MVAFLKTTFTIIFLVGFIIGSSGNVFIALVNCMDWVKRRKLSSVDQILTALAISRIALLVLELLAWWFSVFNKTFFVEGNRLTIINIAWAVTNHFNLWFATCLRIFYLFKIANFSNFVFLYLKWRIKQVVSGILLVSLYLLVLHIVLIKTSFDTWIDGDKQNLFYNSSFLNYAQFYRFVLIQNLMFILIPFAMALTAFLLLIFSLWKHLKRMKQNLGGSRDVSTTAHIKALHTVVAFLFLYIIVFLYHVVEIWTVELKNTLSSFLVKITVITFPTGHTCVLIWGHIKLRENLFKILQWLRTWFKDGELWGP
uniref:Taste receptor type 2 n=1 Tax=Nannospalax galili TaxID=1026970 RepID=A0A0N9NA84_NANGA|nr:taste receptor type 2 member 6 [Nannospalax galili]ALG93500.1 taste receptor type 2 member 6 [Nannospalax galili]ALG93516.1 taste receptor type 2 member 6 [Nannospalax galili]ALG93517.1 taste receptor type 2 member 6 [Nannospalax galili]ALG93540.1 taste receptor type 2 member 6 [Nannospalax galili]